MQCTRCKEDKDPDAFLKDARRKSGYYPYCRSCRVEYNREWREKNPVEADEARQRKNNVAKAFRRDHNLTYSDMLRIRRYGAGMEDYERLLREQKGKCAICGGDPVKRGNNALRLDMDHCHTSGKMRGLLCGPCNRGLGQFNDDVVLMANAIDYLKAHASAS